MERFIFLMIILAAISGEAQAKAVAELQFARDYFLTNNFIFSSLYAEQAIETKELNREDLRELTLIFVESKKELGEQAYASTFLHRHEGKIGETLRKNSEAYLYDQNIHQDDFGRRLDRYNSTRKKITLEKEDLKGLAAADELKALDSAGGKKKPWVAATLSGIVPGAGQVYNGNYQAAAVAFTFNALLLLTTLEFSRKDLAWPAATSGFLFAMTYVGGIVSAGRDAQISNQRLNGERNQKLKRELLPELSLSFTF